MENNIRIHRVGSITAGISMIAMGIMCILHKFTNLIGYEYIFKLWPLMIISLGIEILLSNLVCKKFIYDKAAVFLLILMTFFAIGMAGVDVLFTRVGAEKWLRL